MKFVRFLVFLCFLAPFAVRAAPADFALAAQLLTAARAGNTQQVQALINSGANVNYVDSTGLSIVCTAVMNNDRTAVQVLLMYGADASNCDTQVKQYRNRTQTKKTGGIFSGLSTSHVLLLGLGGAAAVVGGLYLLTDVFDSDNDNAVSSSGDRGNGGTSGGGSGDNVNKWTYGNIPNGPGTATYDTNLASWDAASGNPDVRIADFNYFRPMDAPNNNYQTGGITVPMQNYLLMMHGYSAFAHGYMGQTTFRDSGTYAPVNFTAGSGKPMLVSVITANGINQTGSAGRGSGITWYASANTESPSYLYDKYMNFTDLSTTATNKITNDERSGYDSSGIGSVFNPYAYANGTAPAKIIAGWESGERATGDLYGFVPNGQLAIYRTGGGRNWTATSGGDTVGSLVKGAGNTEADTIEAGDTLTINGVDYVISAVNAGGTVMVGATTYTVADGVTMFSGVCDTDVDGCNGNIAIYLGTSDTDDNYYVNTTGTDVPDAVYSIAGNNVYTAKTVAQSDYTNFAAMKSAKDSSSVAMVNVALSDASKDANYLTLDGLQNFMGIASATTPTAQRGIFITQINRYYNVDGTESTTQGNNASALFGEYAKTNPIIVNPAGNFALGTGMGQSASVLNATFENYAPALYAGLEHMFMTVVAVEHTGGTADANTIAEYDAVADDFRESDYGTLRLSQWTDSDNNLYMSRMCGVAGTGANGIDPWCFAAAGPTTEMAAASAAGAVAAIKGAFNYMDNDKVFTLLALTADGAYLGAGDNGAPYTTSTGRDALVTYLRSMYDLPAGFDTDNMGNPLGTDAYLDVFKTVYGYGLINLKRATMPGRAVYYYDGTNIVSASGNAYWRAAANTVLGASGAFGARPATINMAAYDILESADGTMSLPRVWENSFTLGATDRHGLYMGDVLGDFDVRDTEPARTVVGNIGFTMAVSERPYNDNLNGLDEMGLDYTLGNFQMRADYQHYLTDGASRFRGDANPILSLASDAVASGVTYKSNRWSFGARTFSGAITEEGLLENDPTVTSQFRPATIGKIYGGASDIAWAGDMFAFGTSFGLARESDTILGARTGGLLEMGGGDTMYVDATLAFRPTDNTKLQLRGTFARTKTNDETNGFIFGITDLYSNAFSVTADMGRFNFAVAAPLAVRRGALRYAYADYDIVGDNGMYSLVMNDAHTESLDLSPDKRELRFSGAYREKLGEFTDGAIGFIYRVHPNHTDEFGNESIFMLKIQHRLGI